MKKDPNSRRIEKELLIFALPLMLSNLLQQLYNTVDALIVGRFLDSVALAAVGSSSLLINILIYFFIGLSTGASVLLSHAFGAKDNNNILKIIHTSLALSLIMGTILMAIGFFGAPTFLKWMNTPDEGMNAAIVYVRIFSLGMIPMAVFNMGTGILRAFGDTKGPLYYLAVGVVVHVFLDLIFIAIMGYGTGGAALATTLSQLVPAIMVIIRLKGEDEGRKLYLRRIKIHRSMLADIFKIGAPAGLQSVMMCLANVLVQSKINTFGITIMASFTAYYKVEGFLFMPIEALALGISNFIGKYYGAKDKVSLLAARKACIFLNISITVAMCILYLIFAKQLISIFTFDPKVIDWGVRQIYWCIPLYFLYAYMQSMSGTLRGLGLSIFPMIMALICVCILRLSWIFVGIDLLGIVDPRVIFTAYPITWLAGCTALGICYYKFAKKKIIDIL